MSNLFVCAIGIGTVFFGLIALVFICYILSAVCKMISKNAPSPQTSPAAPKIGGQTGEIANKGEIIAAACAVIAEELGEDVKNIKVVSFKRA